MNLVNDRSKEPLRGGLRRCREVKGETQEQTNGSLIIRSGLRALVFGIFPGGELGILYYRPFHRLGVQISAYRFL